jgi:hypothetical protein
MSLFSIFSKAIDKLQQRRDRLLEGLINAITNPFERFGRYFPGIERAKYFLITANQKIGKSKFADYFFVYSPFFKMLDNPELFRLKVLYFTLEMSPEEKFYEFLAYLLKYRDGIRISPSDLKSTNRDRPVSQEVLDLINSEEYQEIIKKFEETVIYIDDIANPTGINQYCWNYALTHGKLHKKTVEISDEFNNVTKKQYIDYYEPDDPEEYVMVILDNGSNLSPEKGATKMDTISSMSKKFITMRKILQFTPVMIQHQTQQQEGIENMKLDQMKPSAAGLADYKGTTRDVNVAFGLYNPYKFDKREYAGYDITKFQNNIRFLHVIDDRDYGTGGMVIPLFFDGATAEWYELPKPDDNLALSQIYAYLDSIRSVSNSSSSNNKRSISNFALSTVSTGNSKSNNRSLIAKVMFNLKNLVNGKNFRISKIRIW